MRQGLAEKCRRSRLPRTRSPIGRNQKEPTQRDKPSVSLGQVFGPELQGVEQFVELAP